MAIASSVSLPVAQLLLLTAGFSSVGSGGEPPSDEDSASSFTSCFSAAVRPSGRWGVGLPLSARRRRSSSFSCKVGQIVVGHGRLYLSLVAFLGLGFRLLDVLVLGEYQLLQLFDLLLLLLAVLRVGLALTFVISAALE